MEAGELDSIFQRVQRIRLKLLLVCGLCKVQDVDNTGAYHISFYIGLLLLPNYYTNQLQEPLCNAT